MLGLSLVIFKFLFGAIFGIDLWPRQPETFYGCFYPFPMCKWHEVSSSMIADAVVFRNVSDGVVWLGGVLNLLFYGIFAWVVFGLKLKGWWLYPVIFISVIGALVLGIFLFPSGGLRVWP